MPLVLPQGFRFRFRLRRRFCQMLVDVFARQTATHAGAFDGCRIEAVLSQQATDRRAERVVGLIGQRRSLALGRGRRFFFRFGAGLFARAVTFTQATQIWREVTVVPSSSRLHPECHPLKPVLPVPLCQFRFLPALRHGLPRRLVFCAVATVASATDSGRSGTRISTLLIMYPLINRRSARH